MTDPIAAAREKLIELILHYDGSDAFACADAILAAFPQISHDAYPGHTDLMVAPESLDAFMESNPLPDAEPSQDAVETAREIACISLAGLGTTHPLTMPALQFLRDRLADNIATALAAAEARAREECAKKCDALQEAALRRASEPGATQNYATHQQAVADSARECAAAIRCGGVRHLSAE